MGCVVFAEVLYGPTAIAAPWLPALRAGALTGHENVRNVRDSAQH